MSVNLYYSLSKDFDGERFVAETCRGADLPSFDAAVTKFGADAALNAASDSGYSCLTIAARFQRRSIVERLIALGVHVDRADGRGSTALHYSARRGFRPITDALLKAGANPNAVDANGNTPVHQAAW